MSTANRIKCLHAALVVKKAVKCEPYKQHIYQATVSKGVKSNISHTQKKI